MIFMKTATGAMRY